MKVVWTPEAKRDRREIFDYIAAGSPAAAIRMDELFGELAAKLSAFLLIGKPGRVAGTREALPHPSHRLVYEISEETVWILVLVHAARQWPPADSWRPAAFWPSIFR